MQRIAIYARFSSDLQNKLSSQDQIHECKEFVKKNFPNDEIVIIENDDSLTGKFMDNRDGLMKIIASAFNNEFDILVTESLDRLSRHGGDNYYLYDITQYCNIEIWTLKHGKVNLLHIGFQGTMNAMYSSEMAEKVKRGQGAVARRGDVPTGIAYGYKIIYVKDNNGNEKKKRVIDAKKARIIRYIFNCVAKGIPIRQIVSKLNKFNIPSPSGKIWKVNSISGFKSRNSGILNNPIYKGVIEYNVTKKVTHPITKKTKNVVNPISERSYGYNDDLRIISDELWDRAKIEQAKRSFSIQKKRDPDQHHAFARPLTDLVYCKSCGGRKSIAGRLSYVCNNLRYHRSCSNGRSTKEKAIFEKLISVLRTDAQNIHDWKSHFQITLLDEINQVDELKVKKANLEKNLNNYLELMHDNVKNASKHARECDTEIKKINIKLSKQPDIPDNYDNMHELIFKAIDAMQNNFYEENFSQPLSILFKAIVVKIDLMPKDAPRGEDIIIILKDSWVDFYYTAKKIGFIE